MMKPIECSQQIDENIWMARKRKERKMKCFLDWYKKKKKKKMVNFCKRNQTKALKNYYYFYKKKNYKKKWNTKNYIPKFTSRDPQMTSEFFFF